jgi:ribosomal protein L12E/L44/L45/RPP1/RPP2
MLFSKKAEIELFKKQQAELLREEKRMLRDLQEQEIRSKQQSRQEQIKRIRELEDKLLEEIETKARRTRNSSLDQQCSKGGSEGRSLSTSRNEHLDRLKEIQERAKNLLNGQPRLEEIPEKAVSKPVSETQSPVKIPVMIPQSMMRKAQHLPPPTVQRTLKNGEVVTVHLLSDKSRLNDPLVKAEAQLDQKELAAMSKQLKGKPIKQVISEIQSQILNANGSPVRDRAQSNPPKKKYAAAVSLPQAEIPEDRDCATPKGRIEYYNFRDVAMDVVSQQTSRTWVSQRMKQYSEKVKKAYLPKHSEKKELELAMMKERLRVNQPVMTNRVKILE